SSTTRTECVVTRLLRLSARPDPSLPCATVPGKFRFSGRWLRPWPSDGVPVAPIAYRLPPRQAVVRPCRGPCGQEPHNRRYPEDRGRGARDRSVLGPRARGHKTRLRPPGRGCCPCLIPAG